MAPAFGAGGFYLPFDPAATGLPATTWSDYASGAEEGGAPKEYAFDGILGTPGTGAGATFWQGSQPTQIEFPSPMSGRVRLFCGGGIGIAVDDDPAQINPIENKTWDWNDYGDLGTFTKLQFFRGSKPAIAGIEINGFLLVDGVGYSSIGVDASGQANNFQDSGFVVPASGGTKYGYKAVTYTGNGSNQTISGVGFKPDLVWAKARDGGNTPHLLVDSVRGVNKVLSTHSTDPESDYSGIGGVISAFNSDGFDTGSNSDIATNGRSYVAWCWDAGDTTVTNNDGDIASQVRVGNGFSIVTYTGNGGSGSTVGHGLGAKPAFITIKHRSAGQPGYSWNTYHVSIGASNYLALNSTAGSTAGSIFNNTEPTDSVFSLGSASGTFNEVNNAIGVEYVAYCWSEVPGISKIGSYSGTGTDNFIETGFKPAFVLSKSTNNSGSWFILDAARDPQDPRHKALVPNAPNPENPDHPNVFFNDNGFTLGPDTGGWSNFSGLDYVYLAFADPSQSAPDTVLDTPMNNYAVLEGNATITNGALDCASASSGEYGASTLQMDSGKYYCEVIVNSGTVAVGTAPANTNPTSTGQFYYPGELAAGTVIGVAYNADENTSTLYINNVQSDSKASVNSPQIFAVSAPGGSASGTVVNFGQQPFIFEPPEGYLSLYQTWSEWTSALLMARVQQDEARISQLEQVIIAQSVPFEKDKDYPKGAIVDLGGNLLEALVDGADITRSDLFRKRFGIRGYEVEWADLEIKTGQTPDWPEFERPEQPTTLPAPIPEPTPEPEPPLFGNDSTSGSIL